MKWHCQNVGDTHIYSRSHTHTLLSLFISSVSLLNSSDAHMHDIPAQFHILPHKYTHTDTHLHLYITLGHSYTWPLLQVIFIMRIYDVWKPQITEMPLHPTGIYSHHMQTSSYSWHFMHMSLVQLQFCHPTKPLIWTLQHSGLPAHPWNLKCILELSCCGT